MLPGGQAMLFTTLSEGVVLHVTATGERRVLVPSPAGGPRYVPTGHLLYNLPGKLMAMPFDEETLDVTGPSVTALEGTQTVGYGDSVYALSRDGLLVYKPGGDTRAGHFVWLDRQGNREPLGLPPGVFGGFQLSPDGTTVAVPIVDEGNMDIWLFDTTRGLSTRFTFDGLSLTGAAWTPDGKQLAFSSRRAGVQNIFLQPADGSGEAVQLTREENGARLGRMSYGGHTLPFCSASSETFTNDIYLVSTVGQEAGEVGNSEPAPFLTTPFQECFPNISPDGRWMAYYSNETGNWEIYVQPAEGTESRAGGAKRVRVSTGGGEEPIWSHDGRELFYRWGSKIYVVDVTLGSEISVGTPRVLFDGPYVNLYGWSYDVSPDGERFLVVENEELGETTTELIVITNFFDHVRRLTATATQ